MSSECIACVTCWVRTIPTSWDIKIQLKMHATKIILCTIWLLQWIVEGKLNWSTVFPASSMSTAVRYYSGTNNIACVIKLICATPSNSTRYVYTYSGFVFLWIHINFKHLLRKLRLLQMYSRLWCSSWSGDDSCIDTLMHHNPK